MGGSVNEISAFGQWLEKLPHEHKLVIAGNHERLFEEYPARARGLLRRPRVTYLEDSAVSIGGIKFYGSPWQPWFYDWAFNLRRGAQIAAKWALIPDDTDVLLTHGPPFGILDVVPGSGHVGCADLLTRVREIKPKVHAFGHIHEAAGELDDDGIHFVNASNCDGDYQPVNPCRVVDIIKR